MPRKPEPLEPWMLDAIQVMVRQSLSLRHAALQLGQDITPQQADNIAGLVRFQDAASRHKGPQILLASPSGQAMKRRNFLSGLLNWFKPKRCGEPLLPSRFPCCLRRGHKGHHALDESSLSGFSRRRIPNSALPRP